MDGDVMSAEDIRNARTIAGMRLMARYILTPGEDPAIYALSIKNDLTDEEREILLALLLRTFPADQAESICKAHFEGAGYPTASLMENPLADARLWADLANSNEMRSYAMACVEKMTPGLRQRFAKWMEDKFHVAT